MNGSENSGEPKRGKNERDTNPGKQRLLTDSTLPETPGEYEPITPPDTNLQRNARCIKSITKQLYNKVCQRERRQKVRDVSIHFRHRKQMPLIQDRPVFFPEGFES